MNAKGKTQWLPRHIHPVRNGKYECLVMLTSHAPNFLWTLEWDGKGFLVPCPMVVKHWRGLTKAAALAAQGGAK